MLFYCTAVLNVVIEDIFVMCVRSSCCRWCDDNDDITVCDPNGCQVQASLRQLLYVNSILFHVLMTFACDHDFFALQTTNFMIHESLVIIIIIIIFLY